MIKDGDLRHQQPSPEQRWLIGLKASDTKGWDTAASFIESSARTILNKTFDLTTRHIRYPAAIPPAYLSGYPALRLGIARRFISFVNMTGWEPTDIIQQRQLTYVAARAYLRFMDSSIELESNRRGNSIEGEVGYFPSEGQRREMENEVIIFREQHLTEAQQGEIENWFTFFVISRLQADDVLKRFINRRSKQDESIARDDIYNWLTSKRLEMKRASSSNND